MRSYGKGPLDFRNLISDFLRFVVAFFVFLLLFIWVIMIVRAYLLFT